MRWFAHNPRRITVALVMLGAMVIALRLAFPQAARSREKLTLAAPALPQFALLYVAADLELFDEEGLDLTLVPFGLGRDALDVVNQGKADLAVVYQTPLVLHTFRGEKLSAVASLHAAERGTAVVGRIDRGVRRPSDLRGKTIAYVRDTSSYFFLLMFLRAEGIPVSAVRLVNLPPERIADALKSGEVDAIAIWEPEVHRARAELPLGATSLFYSDIYTELSLVVGQREKLAAKREAILRLLRALVAAQEFTEANPEEAFRITRKAVPGVSEAALRSLWTKIRREVRLDNVVVAAVEQEVELFQLQGQFSGVVPDFSRTVTTEYLEEVCPESVTILSRRGRIRVEPSP